MVVIYEIGAIATVFYRNQSMGGWKFDLEKELLYSGQGFQPIQGEMTYSLPTPWLSQNISMSVAMQKLLMPKVSNAENIAHHCSLFQSSYKIAYVSKHIWNVFLSVEMKTMCFCDCLISQTSPCLIITRETNILINYPQNIFPSPI